MINVQSLNQRIATQFAIILLPLVALLAYVTHAESQRADAVSRDFVTHSSLAEARERYAQFLDGAADSVDTGRLSARARQALADAAGAVEPLRPLDPAQAAATAELGGWLRSLDRLVDADASLESLARLQGLMSRVRERIQQLERLHQARLDRTIARSIDDAHRSLQVVIGMSAALLVATLLFIAQFTRGLSRPLRRAVEVADRIASGHKLQTIAIDARHDVGNLLGSLRRMHGSLLHYEEDVARHRRGLEEKVGELAQSQRRLDQAQAVARLGSWQWDAGTAGSQWSLELFRLLGLAPEQHAPNLKQFLRRLPRAEVDAFMAHLRALVDRSGELSIEHRLLPLGGEERVVVHQMQAMHDDAGRLLSLSGVMQDITDRRRAEERMRRLAQYDGLTGLANRQFFGEHLRAALAHARRHGSAFATLFVNLDRFKRINDTLGHTVGDTLLREAAARLVACLRASDEVAHGGGERHGGMVARLGGDEFIVLVRELMSPRDAVAVATRMIGTLSAPFQIEGHELVVTASIGIAMYPTDGDSGDALIKAADSAMHVAKGNGRNTFQFYSEQMNSAAYEKLTLETHLRLALERDQLLLHYQPKIDIRSGAVVGMEALVRWQHPQRGLVPPSRFIPLAEEMGLIVAIGERVLQMACAQAERWRELGLREMPISVNLAGPSFLKPTLAADIDALLRRHGLSPRQLVVEVTESMLMQSASIATASLQQLRALGVRLSLDDFGTGYSSLTYLRRFAVDELKIDQSFVAEMTHNADDAAIVGAIVSLGVNLRRAVVAEGVETLDQARTLQALGCHVMQGYLFSRPVPADEMSDLLGRPEPFAWASAQTATQPT